jgi:hypothetical protein
MAILELFGPDADNGVADELETIRNSGWLINEANLVFMLMQVQWEVLKSRRIYVYDLNNSRPIFDYAIDGTAGTNSKNGKIVLGGL